MRSVEASWRAPSAGVDCERLRRVMALRADDAFCNQEYTSHPPRGVKLPDRSGVDGSWLSGTAHGDRDLRIGGDEADTASRCGMQKLSSSRSFVEPYIDHGGHCVGGVVDDLDQGRRARMTGSSSQLTAGRRERPPTSPNGAPSLLTGRVDES
ncbi:MAG: hypothetical protein MZV63_27270 [Marinilabiliales bacterium]|nr:hypothetical protein [Marinilabiliales bacterium]